MKKSGSVLESFLKLRLMETLLGANFIFATRQFREILKDPAILTFIGRNIAIARKVRGTPSFEFAKQCHIRHDHLSKIELGRVAFSFKVALAISKTLNVSLATLLTKDLQKICVEAIQAADVEKKS
jgi:ribosome-binding protein aMBF1 (putative translation factor)